MTSPTGVIDFLPTNTWIFHNEAPDSIPKPQWYLFAIALILGALLTRTLPARLAGRVFTERAEIERRASDLVGAASTTGCAYCVWYSGLLQFHAQSFLTRAQSIWAIVRRESGRDPRQIASSLCRCPHLPGLTWNNLYYWLQLEQLPALGTT